MEAKQRRDQKSNALSVDTVGEQNKGDIFVVADVKDTSKEGV